MTDNRPVIQGDYTQSAATDAGFYIWHRDTGAQSNQELYHLMQLPLADNAIAQARAKGQYRTATEDCLPHRQLL